MASFTFHNYPILTPEQQSPINGLISRAMEGFEKGTNLAYLPQQLQTDIQAKQAASQKNMIMAKLLQSLMGGEGGGLDLGGNPDQSNLKRATLKAFTGIDLNSRSPEQLQELKLRTDLKNAANKNNLATGAADISREFLQDKASMPEEYLGIAGNLAMAKDILSAKLGDKEAAERLIQAGVAEKLVPEYSGFQLQSQGQKATVHALEHQQKAIRQGWPLLSKTLVRALPSNIQKEIERRHNQAVKEVNKNREEFYKSGGKNRNDFSNKSNSQSNPDFNSNSNSNSKTISWSDIEHTAQLRNMSENEVIDLLAKKNGVSVDEFLKNVKLEN